MLAEDEKYLQDILALFKVTKYKVSQTASRFKLIINPVEFTMETLHAVQTLKSRPVGIEVNVKDGVFLECLKEGQSRKRRRLCYAKHTGKMPKKYDVKKYNEAMRYILGVEDMCEFDCELGENKLELGGVQTISYPILKKIEETGCKITFNMREGSMTLVL
jgi:hypothetical protein